MLRGVTLRRATPLRVMAQHATRPHATVRLATARPVMARHRGRLLTNHT